MTTTPTRQDYGTCEELLATVYNDLMRAARRKTRNEQDAEDLLQNTATRIFSSFTRFEQGTNFRAWSYTVLSNMWLSMCRTNKRHAKNVPMDDHEYAIEAPHADPQDNLGFLIDDRLIAALADLPDEQRDLIIAITVHDMTYKDAAEHFGIPMGTVMSRLSRTKTRLAAALAAGN